MEEHVWSLVELFISGDATDTEIDELAYLLGTHRNLLDSVKEFLNEYQDPDPRISSLQKQVLLTKAENVSKEFARLSRSESPARNGQVVNGYKIPLQHSSLKVRFAAMVSNETRLMRLLLKTTYRQIRQNKAISFINISGLTIGMTTAILIFLWVANELSYDNFNVNRDRIYQVFSQNTVNGQLEADGGLPSILGPVLKAGYPQVEEVNRLSGVGSFVLKNGGKHFESKGLLTDANFFKFFTYPFLEGNPATALKGPHNIVLSRQMAKKLFGDEDPMGKIVKIDSNANFTVTGVMKPLPGNTQFHFAEYIVPLSYMREVHWERNDWTNSTVIIFALMKQGVTRQTASTLFWNVFRDQHVKPGAHGIVQPMADWWLYNYVVVAQLY